jgi:hypothetical protein
VVRFARLIHRPGRVLGGPAARTACGGNLSLLLQRSGSSRTARGPHPWLADVEAYLAHDKARGCGHPRVGRRALRRITRKG